MLFDLAAVPSVPLVGEEARYPVRRVFCVGRNYEAHALEMGDTEKREAPMWFTKAPAAICLAGGSIPYPPGTANCHFEMEMVAAIGSPGFRVSPEEAAGMVFGYACGFDLTRRDLQNAAKAKGLPWDTGKDFENAAVIGAITRADAFGTAGSQRISLKQNGTLRQDARLSEMSWNVPELIAHLSTLYHLEPGDLVYTGTPAGVGPFVPGDVLEGSIDGLAPITLTIGEAE